MHGATAKERKSDRESSSAPNSDSLLSILEKKPSNAQLGLDLVFKTKDKKYITAGAVTDKEALRALKLVSELEGIIPALETAHAFAWLEKLCPSLNEDSEIVINCSGRGDKDVNTVSSRIDEID